MIMGGHDYGLSDYLVGIIIQSNCLGMRTPTSIPTRMLLSFFP